MNGANMYGLGMIKGLSVTLRHFIDTYLNDLHRFPRRYSPDGLYRRKKPRERGFFTIQYPEERLPMYPRFRGSLAQKRNPETGKSNCTGCGACARACPHGCIRLVTSGKGKERIVETFEVNISDCMVCGLCVEACPFDALQMSHVYENAAYTTQELIYDMEDLLANWDKHVAMEQREQPALLASRNPMARFAMSS